MTELSHFDANGNPRMVDVGDKQVTRRSARAGALVRMKNTTADQIMAAGIKKGDVLATAKLAGIVGSKWTPQLIPLCHSIAIDSVEIEIEPGCSDSSFAELLIVATVATTGRTGVEMEALMAVTTAALTVYDMCKSIDREIEIQNIQLVEKSGGRSGHFMRSNSIFKDR